MLTQWRNKFGVFIKAPELAIFKLIGVFITSLTVFCIHKIDVLTLLVIILSFILWLSDVTWQQIKNFVITGAFTACFVLIPHLISRTIETGFIIGLQIVFLMLISCLLVTTSNEIDLISAFEKLISPLKFFRINVDKLIFSLVLCLRFITLTKVQYDKIRCVQKARGLDRNIFALLIPLLIKIFRAADNMIEALIAKGFES